MLISFLFALSLGICFYQRSAINLEALNFKDVKAHDLVDRDLEAKNKDDIDWKKAVNMKLLLKRKTKAKQNYKKNKVIIGEKFLAVQQTPAKKNPSQEKNLSKAIRHTYRT